MIRRNGHEVLSTQVTGSDQAVALAAFLVDQRVAFEMLPQDEKQYLFYYPQDQEAVVQAWRSRPSQRGCAGQPQEWLNYPGREHCDEYKRFVSQAQAQYQRDGEVEVDDNAFVSVNEDTGAYVGAWVFVSYEDVAND